MLIVGCSGGFMSGLCGAWWEGEGVGGGEWVEGAWRCGEMVWRGGVVEGKEVGVVGEGLQGGGGGCGGVFGGVCGGGEGLGG